LRRLKSIIYLEYFVYFNFFEYTANTYIIVQYVAPTREVQQINNDFTCVKSILQ